MKKFQVRDDEKKEKFEIESFRVEVRTRSFITKAVVITTLAILAGVALSSILTNNVAGIAVATHSATTLLGLALGYYLKKSDG